MPFYAVHSLLFTHVLPYGRLIPSLSVEHISVYIATNNKSPTTYMKASEEVLRLVLSPDPRAYNLFGLLWIYRDARLLSAPETMKYCIRTVVSGSIVRLVGI